MAKPKKNYVCSECGYKTVRWVGQCPSCGQWNTLKESIELDQKGSINLNKGSAAASKTTKLSQVKAQELKRISSNIGEFDRVLGGGFVRGQVVLIGGEPGIGKSTLLTQVAKNMSNLQLLYLCGEESPSQIKVRSNRMNYSGENLHLLSETNVDSLIATLESREDVDLAIIDSIQTLYSSDFTGIPGSISQLRGCTQRLTNVAKKKGLPIVLVGHITKGGEIAGPKILEHIIDTVLYLEGDSQHMYRILRTTKNRFGPVSEVGIFEMAEEGMLEVKNPSEIFLEQSGQQTSGSCVTTVMEGFRPLLLEVQVLTSRTAFGYPRRTTSGFSSNRLQVLMAILEKRYRLDFSEHDVYLSVVGGMHIRENAADLAVCLALVSSMKDKPLQKGTVAFGECGLSGEIRKVAHMEARAQEAENLGFTNIITPHKVKSITEAIKRGFSAQ
ncbi:DNA repair protein RadA [candidate division WWE3 bacterium]|nr:DNA repair protein RadA [candidate division WWE3 bacterium]